MYRNSDVKSLKHVEGVQRLLDHLWSELEPLEHLRVFTTLSEFYVKFRRSRGMEFTAYDTAFRTQCQRLKEVNAPLEGVVQAYWFLEKANISEELKRQVISGAGGQYDYSRLRQALVAIVPQVRKEQDEKPEDVRWSRGKSHRVNAVWMMRTKALNQEQDVMLVAMVISMKNVFLRIWSLKQRFC